MARAAFVAILALSAFAVVLATTDDSPAAGTENYGYVNPPSYGHASHGYTEPCDGPPNVVKSTAVVTFAAGDAGTPVAISATAASLNCVGSPAVPSNGVPPTGTANAPVADHTLQIGGTCEVICTGTATISPGSLQTIGWVSGTAPWGPSQTTCGIPAGKGTAGTGTCSLVASAYCCKPKGKRDY